MSVEQQFITSRVGDHIIECPIELLACLQRERHSMLVDNHNNEATLISDAEQIRMTTQQDIHATRSSSA
jgi:hypothetical protein